MDLYITEEIFKPFIEQQYQYQLKNTIWLNRAYGKMLVKCGLLSEENARIIDKGMYITEQVLRRDELSEDRIDLYLNVMDRFYEIVGRETGCLLHVGRSRNDMGSTCNRMQVRRMLWEIMTLLNEVMDVIIKKAKENVNTIVTYYTYGQPAQPGTFAHYLITAFDMLARDYKRLYSAYENANRCPMGAAAGMGTSYNIDREYLCELLGFDSVIVNSLDAVSGVDYLLEAESALAILMSHISRIAQDFIMWASEENHVLDFDLNVATGSSIMPQKKNPITLEHMRARSAVAAGMFDTGISICRNTSLFPNNDFYSYLLYSFTNAVEEAVKPLHLMKITLEHCSVNKGNAYKHAERNFSGATAISEYLAQTYSIPFSDVHKVIRKIALYEGRCLTGEVLEKIAAEELGVSISLKDKELQRILKPEFALGYRTTTGNPAPDATLILIDEAVKRLEQQKIKLEEIDKKLKEAYTEVNSGNVGL